MVFRIKIRAMGGNYNILSIKNVNKRQRNRHSKEEKHPRTNRWRKVNKIDWDSKEMRRNQMKREENKRTIIILNSLHTTALVGMSTLIHPGSIQTLKWSTGDVTSCWQNGIELYKTVRRFLTILQGFLQ